MEQKRPSASAKGSGVYRDQDGPAVRVHVGDPDDHIAVRRPDLGQVGRPSAQPAGSEAVGLLV